MIYVFCFLHFLELLKVIYTKGTALWFTVPGLGSGELGYTLIVVDSSVVSVVVGGVVLMVVVALSTLLESVVSAVTVAIV